MQADTIPFRPRDATTTGSAVGPQAILVSAKTAAALLGIGLRTFRTMDAAGRIPEPVRLSPGCVRWRLSELQDWAEADCPSRTTWAAILAAK